MPRQAHGRSLASTGPSNTRKRKPTKGRGLNALETAERQFPEKVKIRQHRLGEAEDDDDNTPQGRAELDERSTKRRKVADNGNEDASSIDGGSDLDGERWHVGVDDDDEDSDIDSDEAFGESDEERFAGFTFRGSSSNTNGSKKPKGSSSSRSQNKSAGDTEDSADDQDPDDDTDDLGDDAIDLAAALDMNEEEERRLSEKSKKVLQKRGMSVLSTGTDNASDMSGSESLNLDDADAYSDTEFAGENDPETASRLSTFINGLTPARQENTRTQQSSRLRAPPAKPSQFALPSTGLSAADLMRYVKDPVQRQSLKILQAAEQEEPAPYKGGIPGKLAAPLAKRQQDRLDRVAGYDQGKQTLERWVDTVKQNRRAEHVSYPLADAGKESAANVKSFQPVSKNLPQSSLELKIQQIMQESGVEGGKGGDEEDGERRYEELQEKKIPLDEVQARRKELRLQRELMFREEIRAKRMKKIKSKAFRRVHRKERDKFAVQEHERLAAAGMLDSDEERERNDRKRAEERMGARHRESKWAKAAKATGQTTWNEDAKLSVSELARRNEELTRRIEGKTIRKEDDSGSESDSESDGYSADEDGEDEKWKQKLDTLSAAPPVTGKSKLADMAFMRKAEALTQAENDEELRLLRRAMAGEIDEASDNKSETSDRPTRQKFGRPEKKQTKRVMAAERNEFEARLSDEEREGEEEEQLPKSIPSVVQKTSRTIPQTGSTCTPNGKAKPKVTAGTHSGKATTPVLSRSNVSKKSSRVTESTLDDYTSPSESEHEVIDEGLDAKSRLAMDIFAGDDEEDLKKQFEKEKKLTVEEEGDQVFDNTLPGWGSWTGAGVSKREKKKGKGQVLSTIKGVAPEARKDAKLERVIINEKIVKKNSRYLAAELPHPFESRQQYERALRLPMGPEWSTRNHFQDSIKPRVLLKQGQVIKPMARPSA